MNKIDLIQERIDNIQFHIDHANRVIANPEMYLTPSEKIPVDIEKYLLDLLVIKSALEQEKETLTNQG
jgi:hypothetical protein